MRDTRAKARATSNTRSQAINMTTVMILKHGQGVRFQKSLADGRALKGNDRLNGMSKNEVG